jgi:hypothetical protein
LNRDLKRIGRVLKDIVAREAIAPAADSLRIRRVPVRFDGENLLEENACP